MLVEVSNEMTLDFLIGLRITLRVSEGMSRVIKGLQRQAYGFKDMALCTQNHAEMWGLKL